MFSLWMFSPAKKTSKKCSLRSVLFFLPRNTMKSPQSRCSRPATYVCWPWHFLDLRDGTQPGPISCSCSCLPLCRNPTTGPNNRLLRPTPGGSTPLLLGALVGWQGTHGCDVVLEVLNDPILGLGLVRAKAAKAAKRRSGLSLAKNPS